MPTQSLNLDEPAESKFTDVQRQILDAQKVETLTNYTSYTIERHTKEGEDDQGLWNLPLRILLSKTLLR